MSGEANLASDDQNITCKGSLKLNNPVVRGAKVNYPIETQYDLALSRKQDQVQVRSGTVRAGATAVSLSGTINSGTQPSVVNMQLQTRNASIVDLAHLASAFGVAFDANDQIQGSISADMAVKGAVNAPAIEGNLSATKIQAQDLILTNVNAKAKSNNGVIELSPVTAVVFGGQENGTITVDTKPVHPLCSVKMSLTGVDSNALLSAVSSLKNTLYGRIAANGDLNFSVDSSANLARTLNGIVKFDVTNGRLKNVNILNELSRVGKFLSATPTTSGPDTALQKLGGTLNIHNGIATTNDLVATLAEGSLSATGSLSLVDQGLNMHVNAVLASGVSKAVGGTGVGGYLNTALGNNNGELVLPVLVSGTTAHPIFAPDAAAIAKMKLSHLLPTSGDPTKSTSGIVGSVLGGVLGGQSGQKNNQQQQQQSPLNSLFKQLGKKKQQ
jgi:AsmA-like C-terminal region